VVSQVTQRHVDEYQNDGAVRVEGLFTTAWIEALTQVLDEAIRHVRAGTLPGQQAAHPVFGAVEFEEHDGYVRMINLLPRQPVIERLLLASRAPEVVADVIGSDSLRLWVDGTFLKEGNAPQTATPWHNDECTYSLLGEHRPSLWIALTDVGVDNAPLTTLVGSNRDTWRYHSPFSPQDVPRPPEYKPWQHLVDRVNAPEANIRAWAAARGDAIVLHPKTIHGSQPRRANQNGRRLGFSVRWLGDDVVWLPTPLNYRAPFDTHPLMKLGEAPPEALFPIAWRRDRFAARA